MLHPDLHGQLLSSSNTLGALHLSLTRHTTFSLASTRLGVLSYIAQRQHSCDRLKKQAYALSSTSFQGHQPHTLIPVTGSHSAGSTLSSGAGFPANPVATIFCWASFQLQQQGATNPEPLQGRPPLLRPSLLIIFDVKSGYHLSHLSNVTVSSLPLLLRSICALLSN